MGTINAWSRASEVPWQIHDAHKDSKRPTFHPLAPRGWSSDPCGPILYKGRYHLFYQHQPSSAQWYWGLCWDHVVSDDLVHWKNLPPAVVPTPGGLDADGCFSGTVEFDPELGVPVILYTGVYLKTNSESVAAHGLPAPEHDPGTRFVEKQLAAVPADPSDPDLTYWVKLPSPVMALPPAGINISCWRDPYCLKRPAAAGGEWVVLLASGIRGVGGAVLRFRSKHFTHGWEFDGVLASGDNKSLGIRGQDWECPILTQLPHVSREAITAAIAVSTAAIPAAIAAKLPQHFTLTAAGPSAAYDGSSNSRGENADGGSQAAPGTPVLKGVSPTAATSPSLFSFSGLGGSSSSLATAADEAAIHTTTSTTSAPATATGTAASTMGSIALTMTTSTTTSAAAACAAAAAIAAAGSATAAAVAVPAAEATGGCLLALPLTEPALAAAVSAADAAPVSQGDTILGHPAVSVDAWVQYQTQQHVQAAVAAAAGADAEGNGSTVVVPAVRESESWSEEGSVLPTQGDITVIITADEDTDSVRSLKQQQMQQDDLLMQDSKGISSSDSTTSNSSSGTGDKRWWFAMSPDACNNPITWWLGDYDGRTFDIAAADGPHRLDLGTTLYAATLWEDPQGRQLLYGWIQEHRRVPTPPALCDAYSYAGCISTPRVLQLVDGQLWQTPLPEINALRTSVCWRAQDLLLAPNSHLTPLQVVSGTHLDINLTLLPPSPSVTTATAAAPTPTATAPPATAEASAGNRAGLVFKSWKTDGKGAAVLSFDWGSGVLMFDFDEPFPDAYNPHPEDSPERRRVGGKLRHYTAGEPLSLRILLDGSAVEVFTSTGETLTTRMYRGHPPKCKCAGCCLSTHTPTSSVPNSPRCTSSAVCSTTGEGCGCIEDETGIALFAAGAAVTVSELCVWEMGSCWVAPSSPPPQPPSLLQQQSLLAAARQPSAVTSLPDVLPTPQVPESGSGFISTAGSLFPAKSDAAVTAGAEGVGTAGVEGAEGGGEGSGVGQPAHLAAGEQATVQEAFLEELQILAK